MAKKAQVAQVEQEEQEVEFDVTTAEGGKRQELKIQGTVFTIDSPYSEGYQLKANEAAAMNQLLGENVRNNLAGLVRAAKLKQHGWSEERIKNAKAEETGPLMDVVKLTEGREGRTARHRSTSTWPSMSSASVPVGRKTPSSGKWRRSARRFWTTRSRTLGSRRPRCSRTSGRPTTTCCSASSLRTVMRSSVGRRRSWSSVLASASTWGMSPTCLRTVEEAVEDKEETEEAAQ